MALVVAYGIFWLWDSSVWAWQGQVHIAGNRLVSRSEIVEHLRLPQQTPLYRLNPEWLSSELASIPAVSQVAVRRWLFPARLEITVIERSPLVAAQKGSERFWLDEEGVLFPAPASLVKARFPVTILTDLQPGDRLSPGDRDACFEVLATWPKDRGGQLDLRNPKDVKAVVGTWPLRLGEMKDIPTKFGMAKQLEPLAADYRDRLEYIDLRFPASPSFKLKSGGKVGVPGGKQAEKKAASEQQTDEQAEGDKKATP